MPRVGFNPLVQTGQSLDLEGSDYWSDLGNFSDLFPEEQTALPEIGDSIAVSGPEKNPVESVDASTSNATNNTHVSVEPSKPFVEPTVQTFDFVFLYWVIPVFLVPMSFLAFLSWLAEDEKQKNNRVVTIDPSKVVRGQFKKVEVLNSEVRAAAYRVSPDEVGGLIYSIRFSGAADTGLPDGDERAPEADEKVVEESPSRNFGSGRNAVPLQSMGDRPDLSGEEFDYSVETQEQIESEAGSKSPMPTSQSPPKFGQSAAFGAVTAEDPESLEQGYGGTELPKA